MNRQDAPKVRWERFTKEMALSVVDFRRPTCIDCQHADEWTFLDEEPFDGWAFGADNDPGWLLYCGKHAQLRRPGA